MYAKKWTVTLVFKKSANFFLAENWQKSLKLQDKKFDPKFCAEKCEKSICGLETNQLIESCGNRIGLFSPSR
jgi:hypothetical protein